MMTHSLVCFGSTRQQFCTSDRAQTQTIADKQTNTLGEWLRLYVAKYFASLFAPLPQKPDVGERARAAKADCMKA